MIVTRLIAIAAAASLLGGALPTDVSALTKQEAKCAKKMPGTALKLLWQISGIWPSSD